MRRRFGQALRIGVGRHGLALLKTSRWFGAPATPLAEHLFVGGGTLDAAAIGLGLRQLLAQNGHSGWPLSFVLSDELVRLWHVTPPPGSTRLADLEAGAALRFQKLYGESPAAWQLSASWDAGQPFLAAGVPRALLAVLEQVAVEQQLQVVEIVPQFVAGWNQWRGALKAGAWYGLLQGGVLTLGVTDKGRLLAVRAAAVPRDAGPEWLGEHLAREALRLNRPLPERLQVSGPLPQGWHGQSNCTPLELVSSQSWSCLARLAATGVRT
ncbi:MAG: hypothetical protein V4508_24365 [Pseudomonadota bacterium]